MKKTGDGVIEMKAVLYSKDNCQECDRARMLLESLDISYLEYKHQQDFTDKQFIAEFGSEASYPQVAIDYQHLGGLKETLQYFKERNLI
jgi:glutaredoxin